MDQQPNFILDNLSVHEKYYSQGGNDQRVIKNKPSAMGNMSEEELKIRDELESEIESNLEEEIKDGIYHLALRLHRLYQNQKEKNAKQVNKTISEVNISIKMEGGTKIEIKDMKEEVAPDDKVRPWTSKSENMPRAMVLVSNNKKFDWAKSLRSGKGPNITPPIANNNKSNGRSSNQAIVLSNIKYQGFSSNPNFDSNAIVARRNLIGSSGQRKGSSSDVGVDNKEQLELGWKC
ncbi:hypothetical protein EZV62_014685 [Acer yangbiense]|uniref:Uncharacterized protein n=1 Tax=Acer yangbiense TaxID=1000413 RepID=A0A5C7HV97_9ROSI|nr:hypothetical protein EZV62_014685 [Acer yangbiense]